jgi:large subunit ribosomal protein L35Ae
MRDEYVGVVLNYRLGGKSQRPRQCLIKVLGVEAWESKMLFGWKVGWPLDDPKIFGRITGRHGRRGTLKAKFERGLPGQALGSRVRLRARI